MSSSERAFCKRDEFEAGKEGRLKREDRLEIDALYTAYFSLKNVAGQYPHEAAKFPVRLYEKLLFKDIGVYTLRFSVLPFSAHPELQRRSLDSFDGLLTDPNGLLIILDPLVTGSRYPIEQGYLKNYEKPKSDDGGDEAEAEEHTVHRHRLWVPQPSAA